MTMESYIQNLELIKYPRTPHLESSRLQFGDSEHGQRPYKQLAGQYIVIEEKLDGANCAISFSASGELLLQSRGHYLIGGSRERQFNLLKHWACVHEYWLLGRLEDRYILYGEWLHKKHAIFYDALPHYFCEFDIWDRQQNCFLSTLKRHQLLAGGPVLSVPVLFAGIAPSKLSDLLALVKPSLAKTANWRTCFEQIVMREKLDLSKAWQQCDNSDLMEGLYLKIESEEQTIDRLKWVRQDFVQAILDAGQHHSEQPFIPNQLAQGVELYTPQLTVNWNNGCLNGGKL
ncbi:RNA ligase family protein [Gilliamella sp. Occ4-3]|uniref:RNA ligase family protein n=1 Tax=Gilliamella sp. Occ4-3 TaxID=3120254 RepID=UPI000B29E2D3|nr:RNA ligase family protein [Gilliamella apicola]